MFSSKIIADTNLKIPLNSNILKNLKNVTTIIWTKKVLGLRKKINL